MMMNHWRRRQKHSEGLAKLSRPSVLFSSSIKNKAQHGHEKTNAQHWHCSSPIIHLQIDAFISSRAWKRPEEA